MEKQMDEKRRVEEIYKKGGAVAVKKHVEENVDKWKNAKVSIAVTGGTATGKSTFINGIRKVGPGDKGFAQPGSGDTTIEPKKYKHPYNDKIEFIDLPGFGTLKFPMSKYIQKMKIRDYDYFLIFFDRVISENDVAVVRELKKMDKPFCFVRSKIDADLENAKYDGRQKSTILFNIRKSAKESLAKYGSLKADAMFVVSGRDTNIGELPELLDHMKRRMPFIKYESIIRSLESFSSDVIEQKYQLLRSSLFWKSLRLAFQVTSKVYSLKDEYTEYLKAFNIRTGPQFLSNDKTLLNLLNTMENTNLEGHMSGLAIAGMIGTVLLQNVTVLFPPFIFGSIFSLRSNGVKIYLALGTMLDKTHDMAIDDFKKHVHSKP